MIIIKKDDSIYKPYSKTDFQDLWFNYETETIEPFTKIIRPLTYEEKSCFEKIHDYDEEMYLIENSKGEQWEVFDNEILNSYEFTQEHWFKALKSLVNSLEYNEELMQKFLADCKIEKFIKKYY